MKLMAIDPGNRMSAYVLLDTDTRNILAKGKVDNETMRNHLMVMFYEAVVIEQIAAMGMAVGAEVFETCVWSGRFIECAVRRSIPWHRLKRTEIKIHLCGSMRAKDGNIRQALIDRYGGPDAIGRKANPGRLYGVSADIWSALAVGTVWADQHNAAASWQRKFDKSVAAIAGCSQKE